MTSVILVFLAVASAARAAYVKSDERRIAVSDYYGEINHLTVSDEGGDLVIRDESVPLVIQDGN